MWSSIKAFSYQKTFLTGPWLKLDPPHPYLPGVSNFPAEVSSCEATEHLGLEFQHEDNPEPGYSSKERPKLHQMRQHEHELKRTT